MRILIAGDVHGNARHLAYLADCAVDEGCDRIFQLGDWGAWEHFPSGVKFFDDADRIAREHGIVIYWLDGNHDKTSLVLEMYGELPDDEGFLICRPAVRYAPRGHRWTWAGKRFMSLGGAYSIDKGPRLAWEMHDGSPPGTQWFPEEEATDEHVRCLIAADPSAIDVMLTHDKPRASNPGWNRKDLTECWPNQDRIQAAVKALNPKLLVHGHLHYRYTDRVRTGDGTWCRVEGLDADPPNAAGLPEESWLILDIDEADGWMHTEGGAHIPTETDTEKEN